MSKPISRFSRRAFTLVETLVVIGVFALILVMTSKLLFDGFRGVSRANSHRDAEMSLNKAYLSLRKDIESAASGQLERKRISLAGGGDAVWFLSANDPSNLDKDTQFVRESGDGNPEWQTHILYYLARPGDYSDVSLGPPPAIDPDPLGDYFAPHKFLIRKVIDTSSDPEVLMNASEIDTYITTPNNYNLASFSSETNVLNSKIVADRMLGFQTNKQGRTLNVEFSATQLDKKDRKLNIGSGSLKNNPLTKVRLSTYLLRN